MNKSLVTIINNCETDYGIELDPDFDVDAVNELCYNDYCNENCDCVDNLYKAIGEQLELQLRAEESKPDEGDDDKAWDEWSEKEALEGRDPMAEMEKIISGERDSNS